jgi:hypothetical protein
MERGGWSVVGRGLAGYAETEFFLFLLVFVLGATPQIYESAKY